MRVTFVGIGWENLGISLLSALAKREGHTVSLAYSTALFNDRYNLCVPGLARLFDDRKQVLDMIQAQRPDVVAFSAMTSTVQWMLGIAQDVKALNPDIKTVFGGVHVSAVPDQMLQYPCVDYVCIGEGDIAFPLILRQIEQAQEMRPIVNTCYKTADGRVIKGAGNVFIRDLDSLPFFDKTIWEEHIRIADVYFTLSSRGCPYQCTYCFNNYYAGLHGASTKQFMRQRSVDHMMGELLQAKKKYRVKFIDFEDDIFIMNQDWLESFLDRYKREICLPFHCNVHPVFVNERNARILADAGCQFVQMGIQSMDDDYKRQVLRRQDRTEHIEKALGVLHKNHLKVKADHMFALPAEPLDAQEKAMAVYRRQTPYRIQTFWTHYSPGLALNQYALQQGILSLEELEKIHKGLETNFYREGHNLSRKRQKYYGAYEAYFKLLPLLPASLRYKVSPRIFFPVPIGLTHLFMLVFDVTAGLFKANPDHWGYARHYLYHLGKSIGRCFGLKFGPATKIHSDAFGKNTRNNKVKPGAVTPAVRS
ncbi:MAG: B12-binding domain-containing radical SAM protein [Candidatus Omnitrophica bacterium]|nr:B12-binding domain-containing radical SAM protein [Candidatus Omnitrophota bacterium]